MKSATAIHLRSALGRALPEKRLFLRSDTETRFVRLSPGTQAVALGGGVVLVGWAIVASAILLMDGVWSGNLREQAAREQQVYEDRLNALSTERDRALEQASEAHERFNAALDQVSEMQSDLLASETRRSELARGIDAARASLRRAMDQRDTARVEARTLERRLAQSGAGEIPEIAQMKELRRTLDFVTAALDSTAGQRDAMAAEASEAEQFADDMVLEAKLLQERNDRIFSQLEDALTMSVKPLDEMFSSAGLDTEELLDTVRRGFSGQGGPLTPITLSTKGSASDADRLRANSILGTLDRLNLYRIAAQKVPFALPVKQAFRFTSGFGPRWGRMHEGTDLAAGAGTPIYATADGVVTHAGWQSGYGRLVKIQHKFGIETRYAHQSRLRVEVGQRVSRGDRIGDMGTSGRSTGVHLHYEVLVNGRPVDPMTYIKAAKDVF